MNNSSLAVKFYNDVVSPLLKTVNVFMEDLESSSLPHSSSIENLIPTFNVERIEEGGAAAGPFIIHCTPINAITTLPLILDPGRTKLKVGSNLYSQRTQDHDDDDDMDNNSLDSQNSFMNWDPLCHMPEIGDSLIIHDCRIKTSRGASTTLHVYSFEIKKKKEEFEKEKVVIESSYNKKRRYSSVPDPLPIEQIKCREVIRGKEDREKLQMYDCTQCKDWNAQQKWDGGGGRACATAAALGGRHRFAASPTKTPPGYWDVDFAMTNKLESTQRRTSSHNHDNSSSEKDGSNPCSASPLVQQELPPLESDELFI